VTDVAQETTEPQADHEDGFEYDGVFYRWHVSDTGKDLMLIDRLTGMPVQEFFDLIEDGFDRGRGPILLAMIATSIRHRFPDRSVERILRQVQNLSISEIEFVGGDEEDGDEFGPPSDGGQTTAAEQTSSDSPADESSSPATPEGS